MDSTLENIERYLSKSGLCVRGIAEFDEPITVNGLEACRVVLIGHVGSAHWDCFEHWLLDGEHSNLENPLDDWSKSIIKPLADQYNGVAVFPSDKPYYPFQKWALGGTGLSISQINILISEEFGTWHGYRGAIAFDLKFQYQKPDQVPSDICAACTDKPCLTACPVNAFGSDNFLYAECQSYLHSHEGEKTCMEYGCSVRNACPYGQRYKYKSSHMKFHMRAFSK